MKPLGASASMAAGIGVLCALAAASCDPCFGVSSCSAGEVVALSAQVIDARGNPVEGVRVDFVRTDGVELSNSSFGDVSDDEGWVELRESARGAGEVLVDIVVTGPSGVAHRYPGVTVNTSRTGDAVYFGRIRARPFISYLVQTVLRANGDPMANAAVVFERTGGVTMDDSLISLRTDAQGLTWLEADVDSVGVLVGRWRVQPADRDTVLVSQELRLRPFLLAREQQWLPIAVGPSLGYAGRLLISDSVAAHEVEVSFQRVGGLDLVEDSITVSTDGGGNFPLFLEAVDPYATGEVWGRLHVNAPAAFKRIDVDSLTLVTFDADTVNLVGKWYLEPATP